MIETDAVAEIQRRVKEKLAQPLRPSVYWTVDNAPIMHSTLHRRLSPDGLKFAIYTGVALLADSITVGCELQAPTSLRDVVPDDFASRWGAAITTVTARRTGAGELRIDPYRVDLEGSFSVEWLPPIVEPLDFAQLVRLGPAARLAVEGIERQTEPHSMTQIMVDACMRLDVQRRVQAMEVAWAFRPDVGEVAPC